MSDREVSRTTEREGSGRGVDERFRVEEPRQKQLERRNVGNIDVGITNVRVIDDRHEHSRRIRLDLELCTPPFASSTRVIDATWARTAMCRAGSFALAMRPAESQRIAKIAGESPTETTARA